MSKILLSISIGLRLKLVISILVSVVIIILGILLYNYQKENIFDHAKQNCYATINDLIRFTQNEIDANKDKIGNYGEVVNCYMNSLGKLRQEKSEIITYTTTLNDKDTTVEVPAIYRGNTRIQGDTTIIPALNKMGVDFFLYYQKIDSFYVEILNTEKQQFLKENIVSVFPDSIDGLWNYDTGSFWIGNRWEQIIRIYTKDEKDKIKGVMIAGIKERNELKLRNSYISKTFYKTGLCYQLSENGEITYHKILPDFYKSDNPAIQHIVSKKMVSNASYISAKDSMGVVKYFFYKYYPTTYNNVVIEIPKKEIFTSLYALRNGIVIAIIVIIIGIFLAVNYLAETITSRLNKAIEYAKRISSGDLTSSIPIDSSDELAELGESLNQMNDVLKKTVSGITSAVEIVNGTSVELNKISKNIAIGASNQASSLEEISSSMEEMTSTVEQNTLNAQKTESISGKSAQNIQNSSVVLQESVTYMNSIVDKISLINDISFQTNILSLNAAVEAARAGEYGRGFSVVANEVRSLAERSRIAADEIGKVSKKGKSVAHEADTKLIEYLPLVHQTADLVREISVSSMEQNEGIKQINVAIQGLNTITQQNAYDAKNITVNMNKMEDNSKALKKMINFFKI